MNRGLRIEKLRADHPIDAFDCGKPPLDRFLKLHALQSQRAGASTTYVAVDAEGVAGFHSLAFGHVEYSEAPPRLIKGIARHPVPVMLLARLAVATERQGAGLGSGLLKDAMLRTLAAADIAGLRAILVHAKDDEARRFYERYDFTSSPSDPYHLMVLLKDVRAMLRES